MGRVKEVVILNQELRSKAEELGYQEWIDEQMAQDLAEMIDENEYLNDLIKSHRQAQSRKAVKA